MKIKYTTRPTFKVGDRVQVKEDCEWKWEKLRGKTWTVDFITKPLLWRGSQNNIKRPGLRLKSKIISGSYDSFGFEHENLNYKDKI